MKKRVIRLIASIVLFAAGYVVEHFFGHFPALFVFIASWAVAGYDVVIEALSNIFHGEIFDENLLMSIASIGAFFTGQFAEAAAVMNFYQVGETFQAKAVGSARSSIASLMDIRPEYANVLRDGSTERIAPQKVDVGELILIKPGERVPLDCVVLEGSSMADTSALTGESVPREVFEGSELLSGFINNSGLLTAKVTKVYRDSAVSKILELVENSAARKAKIENFITRFARYYTPGVVVAALLLAFVPPFVLHMGSFADWGYRALTFLVVSCPCALVISVPLGFFGGIGGASKRGILFKGSSCLEALGRVKTMVFDKTGTLTKGSFDVTELHAERVSEEELLCLAASAEQFSDHPIAKSLRRACSSPLLPASDIQEIAGLGIEAAVAGSVILAGNRRLMERSGISFTPSDRPGTVVYIARDHEYLGYVLIADTLKPDVRTLIPALKKQGVEAAYMLTGDNRAAGEAIGKELGLDRVYAELLPGDKVEHLERIMRERAPGFVAYAGDGINDAPVLARADVGIAMGGLGSDAAIEAADVVLMTDEPARIADAMAISRRTMGIIRQNIAFALGVKAIILLLSAIGYASMWAAVFADVGVALIAILNAMRALKYNPEN